MSIRTSRWPAGVPCWTDLMAPDLAAASAFYTSVLGWTVPEPDEQWGGCVVAQRNGADTVGIGPMQPGARTAWTLYLATDDADATTAAVTEHGGSVLAAPMDVGPLGRLAIVADPTGAIFGLWQAGTMIGASLVNEPGGLYWEDLRSTDPKAAQAFYGAVFGYRFDPVDMAPDDYATFSLKGEQMPLGGAGGLMGSPADTPSHWLVYFAVADTDEAVATAEGGGGKVLQAASDTPWGRMACLADPAGAVFMVMSASPSPQEPDLSG